MGRASISPDLADDFERWYYFKGPFAYTRMVRPEGFTQLIDEMLAAYDLKKHKELVQKGVRWMHEEAFVTPLFSTPRLAAAHQSVHGLNWYENALSQHWTPEDAWLDN